MEKMFESYIAKKLRKTITNQPSDSYWSGWNVRVQYSAKYLFDKPKKFRLRPDIVLEKKIEDKTEKIILDTKWKCLENDESKNYGISQADMYQMFAYGHKFDCPKVWLLYPKNGKMDGTINSFKSEDNQRPVNVYVHCIDLKAVVDANGDMQELLQMLKNND